MGIPYAEATSGMKARNEIMRILKRFGASEVGFLENYEKGTLGLYFMFKGRRVQMEASAKGWAALYLKDNPWTTSRHSTKEEYHQKWIDQGFIAVNSILRDWIKGQVTAIETEVISFEALFLPWMLTADGTPLIDKAKPLLLEG